MSPLKTKKRSSGEAGFQFTPYAAILRDKRRNNSFLSSMGEWLAVIQGIYYCITGLWPWISMSSFTYVTGAKTDLWLVQVVGLLVFVIGAVLIIAAIRSVLSLELGLLMVGCSLGLALIELTYVMKAVIPMIYLVDAAEEALVLILTLIFLPTFTHRRHSTFV
jgi:hypothetical protein